MTYLGIDPGNTDSGFAIIDTEYRPVRIGKVPNHEMRAVLLGHRHLSAGPVGIEMIASYGMAVGRDVFETCVEIGRLVEIYPTARLVYRKDIKMHFCGTPRAKDPNVVQALIDRFASGQPNRGKGTKAAPGWFHGFKSDIWQAYAVAVYLADTYPARRPA